MSAADFYAAIVDGRGPAARAAYLDACSKTASLGQGLRLRPQPGGYQLVATARIPRDTAVTAFAPDAVWPGALGAPRGAPHGPLVDACDAATLDHLAATVGVPVDTPGARLIVSDPQPPHNPTPDLSGIFVDDVVDSPPYAGLDPSRLEVLVQATAGLLQKISALSNVRLATVPGQPPYFVTLRSIAAGEVLRSGKTPLYHLSNNVKLAEAVAAGLANDRADLKSAHNASLSIADARALVGLPG